MKVLVLNYGNDEERPLDSQQKAEAKFVNRNARAKANQAQTK